MGKRIMSICGGTGADRAGQWPPPPHRNRQSWPNAMASSAARPIPMVRSCQVSIRSAERQRQQNRHARNAPQGVEVFPEQRTPLHQSPQRPNGRPGAPSAADQQPVSIKFPTRAAERHGGRRHRQG